MVEGRYTPIRRLGSGGMADVFLSRERGDGGVLRIALKRIIPELARDARFREMFDREVEVAMRLAHPNVVPVRGKGAVDADLYLTMEYVQGRSLHEVLVQAARLGLEIPFEAVMAIGIDVARGLHYAHDLRAEDGAPLGIVHGNLSPRNVLIGLDGSARITDFGLSVAAGAVPPEARPAGISPGYLSPEQARGEPIDHRTDVFSLGVMLWELTAGRKLYQVRDAMEALERIGVMPIPSAAEQRAPVPGWEGVLRRALAAGREHRYATARALQHDIEDVARAAAGVVSNLPVVGTLATLFPELATEVAHDARQRQPSALVVDDENQAVELITRALRPAFHVRTASSVDDAIRLLAVAPADVVVTDERMAGRRGTELLAHVAQHSPRTVRVMTSAFGDTELMLAAINRGRVHRFAVKPFRGADLRAMVEDALAERPPLPDLALSEIEPAGDPGPPALALPWNSLLHLASAVRDNALSCVLVVGVADGPLGENDRAAVEWAVSARAGTCWAHVEGRGLVLLVPGVTASVASSLAVHVREMVIDLAGTRFALALADLPAGVELAEVGARAEEAALAAWRKDYGDGG